MEEATGIKLGPDSADKIAIVGSAPASVRLAPYRDPTWAIWGCSPGAYGFADRKDVWFEMHRWEPQEPGFPGDPHAKPWYSPEYVAFLQQFPGPVFMSHAVPSVRNCVLMPFQYLIEKYGPYHFTSSIAWMLALAIEQKPKAIGLWGIDMAAAEEWADQRPGCQHFLGVAKAQGIEIVLPPESDLLQPKTMYGVGECHPRQVKLTARLRELQARKAQHDQQFGFHQQQALFLSGAIDNLNYVLAQWTDDVSPDIEYAISRSAVLPTLRDPLTEIKGGRWRDLEQPNAPKPVAKPEPEPTPKPAAELDVPVRRKHGRPHKT
jgi:hypothetical protein